MPSPRPYHPFHLDEDAVAAHLGAGQESSLRHCTAVVALHWPGGSRYRHNAGSWLNPHALNLAKTYFGAAPVVEFHRFDVRVTRHPLGDVNVSAAFQIVRDTDGAEKMIAYCRLDARISRPPAHHVPCIDARHGVLPTVVSLGVARHEPTALRKTHVISLQLVNEPGPESWEERVVNEERAVGPQMPSSRRVMHWRRRPRMGKAVRRPLPLLQKLQSEPSRNCSTPVAGQPGFLAAGTQQGAA
jgi:hypothetical protein